jgi:EAL domain-containing protein (putative c-di-GMP-specific phosphodiesterase class I)/CheY-like chemotaxis protein
MTGGKVLLVDDDAQITRMIRGIAEQSGFSVTEVNDPLLFEHSYKNDAASLIILDLNMPGKDGIELLDFLAEVRSNAQLMFVSGADRRVLGTMEKLAVSRGLNFAGVLEKPVNLTLLRQALDEHARKFGVATVADLDRALDSDQINVAYQPKVDLTTGAVVGVEALARWNHATLGPISPEIFVGMAEDSGRITTLTQIVLNKALRAAREWLELYPDIQLAVNLSPRLLSDSKLPDRILDTLKSREVAPELLKLEITERSVMEDVDLSMSVLSRIRLKEVDLSIDDFGTGSSSLVQLYRMPFGEIKIDRSFVMDMLKRREAEVIVNSIIQLGKSMELTIVAEGVEDRATLERLRSLGCDQAQGYFISRPVSKTDFAEWLADYTPGQLSR